MSAPRKPFLISLAILLVLCLFRIASPSDLSVKGEMSPFFKTFPLRIQDWQGREIEPDEKTLEILETRNVLSREYTNADGEVIYLLLVSSRRDRRVAHPPEVCYIGSNFNIVDEADASLDVEGRKIPVRQFRAIHERELDNQQEVGYLYKVGNRFTTNYYAQQLQFAMDSLSRKESEVLLIRVAGRERDSVSRFIRDLMPLLDTSR